MGKQKNDFNYELEVFKQAWELCTLRMKTEEVAYAITTNRRGKASPPLNAAEKDSSLSIASIYPAGLGLLPIDDRIDYPGFVDPNSEEWLRFKQTGAYQFVQNEALLRDNITKAITATATVMLESEYNNFKAQHYQKLDERIWDKNKKKPYCGRFYSQVSMARGTGVLVGKDLLLTAYHNLKADGIDYTADLVYIFNYHLDAHGNLPTKETLIVRKGSMIKGDPHADWALVQLNAQVALPYLEVSDRVGHPEDELFYLVGCSSGLPLKLSMVGTYVKRLNKIRFRTNLDTFHGNSGSPVINLVNNKIEGILVGGADDIDFDAEGECARDRIYLFEMIAQNLAGEICVAAHIFSHYIQNPTA